MPRSHLTLAALVVAALPDFDPVSSQPLSTSRHGEFDSACVKNADGRALVVRVPTNETAASDLAMQITVLSAMSAGVRSLMPFEVPTLVGRTVSAGAPVAIFDYIEGNIISLGDFDKNIGLATTIGRSIAYIHQVPYLFAQEAGVPVFSTSETQRQSAALVDRGRATGLLPTTLAERWRTAVEDDTLWQFTPSLVHGSLGVDRFLLGSDSVTGVLGWGSTRVGDPAWDLHWIINLDLATASEAFAAYDEVRLSATDPKVRQRAVLYSELELVRWLLHGLELNRQDIVDDAIAMMDRLIDTVRDEGVNTVGQATEPVLSVSEVETLLASVPVAAEAGIEHTPDFATEAELRYEVEVAETVELVETAESMETVETVETVELVETVEYVERFEFTDEPPMNDLPTEPNPIVVASPDDEEPKEPEAPKPSPDQLW